MSVAWPRHALENAGVHDLVGRLLEAKAFIWTSWDSRRTAHQTPIGATNKPRIHPRAQHQIIAQIVTHIDRDCCLIRRRVGRRLTVRAYRVAERVKKSGRPKDCFSYSYSPRHGKIRR